MNGFDRNDRKYPPFWEKFIPVFLAVIALAILGLVLVALSVIFGWLPIG